MQVSFGQFIPVSIKYSEITKGKRNTQIKSPYRTLDIQDIKKAEEITDKFALSMSRREEKPTNDLKEQQRRVFRANIDDYSIPPTKGNIAQDNNQTSAVVGLTINSKRYLVTGAKDVSFVQGNLYRQISPSLFERDVVNYINNNKALSYKTIDIYASEYLEPDTNQEQYKVNMIDFHNSLNSKPITGEC